MYIGERFEKNGKTYEVTSVFGSNFGFKEVEPVKKVVPVFDDKEDEKPVVKKRAPRKKV